MSEDERLDLVDKLRYVAIDVIDSRRGRWVSAVVFGAAWISLGVWLSGWGVLLGWIPAAALAVYLGYVCR